MSKFLHFTISVICILILSINIYGSKSTSKRAIHGYSRISNHQNNEYIEPYSFVERCFESKDIVFLGEPHHVKQHLIFLQNLIPRLHQKGISNLCYEFLPYDRQPEIDKLVNSKKFDYQLASDLVASHYVEWTEKEYIEVLKVIWEVNIKSQSRKFRIIGLGNSTLWSEDRFKKWTEKDWAGYIKIEVIDKKEKALVFCGAHHAITKFQQPYYDAKTNSFGLARKDRLGHFIYSLIGEKCITIWLYHLWPDKHNQLTIFPCNRQIDSVYLKIGKPFGFFTNYSQIGNFTDTTSIYGKGYKDFKLKQVADGFIVLNAICDYELTSYRPVVTKKNLTQSLAQVKLYYGWQHLSVHQLNDSLKKSFELLKIEQKEFLQKNCH